MASRLVGVYDDRNTAQQVQQELIRAGFREGDIRLVAGQATGSTGSAGEESWWGGIKDFFGFSDAEDTHTYREAARRGATLLTVNAGDQQIDQACDIMERHGSVNLEQRSQQWRSEGWQGYQTAGATTTSHTHATTAQPQARAATSGEQAIPVVEEQLQVGKRAVQRGGVRVHSHITERPVEAQVRLHEEHVHVERRPVNRPIADTDAAFQERTIEARERGEEAVVSKQARVVEEIVVGKEATERTETVRDTVRRTDVDVEKTDPNQTGTTRKDTSRDRV